jgi:carbamoyl-phosphate synthase large subunit
MNDLGVLITSAGRRNQLMRCFRSDAAALGVQLRVLAADLNPALSPACQEADAAFAVPRCTEPGYVAALLEICAREKIGLLVPTIDPELAVLSAAAAQFASAGVRVVVSGPAVVATANDKAATARLLAAAGLPTPRTVSLPELRTNPTALEWPVIIKPNAGSASVGIRRLADPSELPGTVASDAHIAQECWRGTEYTVNVFFSGDGRLQCAIPHERIEVRSGEVSKGRTVKLPCLMDAAQRVAAALPGAHGPLCFQTIVRPDGQFVVFEINARFGGGFPLAHRAGGRFTQWLLEEYLGRAPSYSNDWREGVMMLRYDTAVFLNG